jgi:hypothetical protein
MSSTDKSVPIDDRDSRHTDCMNESNVHAIYVTVDQKAIGAFKPTESCTAASFSRECCPSLRVPAPCLKIRHARRKKAIVR